MANNSTKLLTDLVNKRLRCLTQLVELGERQSRLIDAGETAELLRLLAVKGQLISALQAIERGLAPFHDDDPEARQWDAPDARAACAAEAQQCRKLLARVMELETANEARATERRDAVARQLQTLGAASRARDGYRTSAAHRSPAPKHPLAPSLDGGPADGLDVSSEI